MKTVFSNHQQVAHVWAQQNQSTGRTSNGNVYFNNSTIYSYGLHFPIASFVKNAEGKPALLMTTRDHSISTSKHKSLVRRAINYADVYNGMPVFNVIDVSSNYSCQDRIDHHSNCHEMQTEIKQLFVDAAKSRLYKDCIMEHATKRIAEMQAYIAFFKPDIANTTKPEWFDVPTIPSNFDAINASIKIERESAKIARLERQKREDERERANAMLEASALSEWMSGGDVRRYFTKTELRIKGDEVQTSRGASFPVAHARRGLALVEAVIARGEEWKRNGHTCHLGHYQIDRISPDGTVYAGCHVVTYSAIQRIADDLRG